MKKASLSSCPKLTSAAQIRAQSSLRLPVPYPTRTLFSKPKTANWFRVINSHASKHDKRRRSFCSTPREQVYVDKDRRLDNDLIVFVDSDHIQSPDTRSYIRPQKKTEPFRPSTVTASEQAAFDKLINDVSQPKTVEPDDDDIVNQDDIISGYDPDLDLDSIFDYTINKIRLKEEEAEKALARFSLDAPLVSRAVGTEVFFKEIAPSRRAFIRPLQLANGMVLGEEAKTANARARLAVACDEHKTLVMGMLDSADSDREIWQVLENEVFIQITHLNDHIKILEKKKESPGPEESPEAKELPAAKARKVKAKAKDVAGMKPKKGDVNREEISTVKLTPTKAIPVNYILVILQQNYADYFLHALRLLRRRHPTSTYAPRVLSTIKQRGPISYVLGASTDIYNEIIFLQWTQHSDLHAMVDTIEEMLNQGIEGNEVTVEFIRAIATRRYMAKRGFAGPVMEAWWQMTGNVEAWRRVLGVYNRIMIELAEREVTRAEEDKGDDEELVSDRKRRQLFPNRVREVEGDDGELESDRKGWRFVSSTQADEAEGDRKGWRLVSDF